MAPHGIKKKTFSREAGKLHLQMRKKKLGVSEKISYKMHPVMLDVYNFCEILSIGDWKKLTPKEFIGFEHVT